MLHQNKGIVGKKQCLYLKQYAAFKKKLMWNFNNANNALPICPSEIHKLFWEELLSDDLLFAKAFNFKCQACKSSRFEVKQHNQLATLKYPSRRETGF